MALFDKEFWWAWVTLMIAYGAGRLNAEIDVAWQNAIIIFAAFVVGSLTMIKYSSARMERILNQAKELRKQGLL